MTTAGTRREARERAVELLYEADSKSAHPEAVIGALPIPPDPYAVELATGVADHVIEIDAVLGRYATKWPVSRMAAMDRMVLRLGVFELATQLGVPRGVCLSEAVELGSRYGSSDDTAKFVNGVLAAVADEVRDGSRSWIPIETVVFDMDGVIRTWTTSHIARFEERHGLTAGSVAEAAFGQPLFDDAMLGRHTAEEWAERIAGVLAEQVPDIDEAAVVGMWLASSWEIDESMVAVVDDLRAAGIGTALFSNASTHLEADLETMGIAGKFDVVANSSRIGRKKPDPAAFTHVAEMVGVAPSRMLFVDDHPANVAGAVEAGWHAVLMRGAAPFRDVLRRLSLSGV